MNNKGFGLSEMLGILFVFVVCILIILIISAKSFKGVIPNSTVNYQADSSDKDTAELNRVDYTQFESKMEKSAKEYLESRNSFSTEQITMDELIASNNLDPIIDPIKKDTCFGYVIHSIEENTFKAYLRCPGSYRTIGYDQSFES